LYFMQVWRAPCWSVPVIASIASAFVITVPTPPVSASAAAFAAGQLARADTARRTAERFALPPEDRPAPKPAAAREPARDESRLKEAPAEPGGQPAPGSRSAADAKSTSLVGMQEAAQTDGPDEGGAAAEANEKAEDRAAGADQISTAAEAAQQQSTSPAMASVQEQAEAQQQVSADAAAEANGDQRVTDEAALEAATVAMQANAATDKNGQLTAGAVQGGEGLPEASSEPTATIADKVAVMQATVSGASTASANTGEGASGGEALPQGPAADGSAIAPGAGGSTLASSQASPDLATGATDDAKAASVNPADVKPADAGTADFKAAADKQAEQSGAAAKTELAARLEQSFGQPQARPAENVPAPLPAASALPELPKAIPPSAVPMEIGLRSLQGLKEFQIRLDPAELGRIDVKLEIGDDKSVTARVVVDRVETLHLLQREAKTLERAFEQAGLKSSDAGVDITLRDPGQQSDQGRREGWPDETEMGLAARRGGKSATIETPIIPIRRTLHVGALDLSI
jgi:flagellar hook-length control protein FliK